MIYCTLLNPAFDLIYPVDSFVPGGALRDIACTRFCAGKGINVARVVRTLGEEACVIGVMPEEDEKRFVSYLESREIYYRFFRVPGEVRLNVTVIEKQGGTASHLNSGSPKVPQQAQNAFMRFVGGHLSAGDLWCFCGSIVPGFDDDLYGKMIKRCREAGVDTFLDTRGKALGFGVRARPTALKPNITELEELYEEKIRGVRHMALKGKKLLDRGVPYVFISLGSDGMMALHGSECLLCAPPQVRSVDTVGCGDALMAGVLVGWQRKLSFRETCRLATACGASKAMHEGPHTVVKEEVKRLTDDVKITAV
ncbi:MAG: 1-phosphofructokinase family hexose kinase [Chitinispirillaceae bacterium]|nr:1-phosphofructokinase family hexose kinase [Chitinispirillaceae bacterium]